MRLFHHRGRTAEAKRCRTLDSAKAEAQKFIRDRTEHQPHQREISLPEFADWSAAMRMLRGREQTTLVEAVAEWARAHDALGGRGTLADATAAFARTVRETKLPAITVPALVAKFAVAKKAEGLSALYVDDIEKKLTRFSKTFRGHIGSINDEVLRGLRLLKKHQVRRPHPLGCRLPLGANERLK